MTVRLELKPEVEAALIARAQAMGISLDAYLQNVIEEFAETETALPASLREFRDALDALADMGKGLPCLPSSAISRDSIYGDHA